MSVPESQSSANLPAELPLSPSLRDLAATCPQRAFPKGTLLIREGEQDDGSLFIVVEGRIKAYSHGDNEREITYGIYGPGEYVGEMSLDGGPRSANVVTLEATRCVTVARSVLLEHLERHPECREELLAKVIHRARSATDAARQLALTDVYGRLRSVLLGLVERGEDGVDRIPERLTHQELASRVGCSREMISRLMKDLTGGGFVIVEEDGMRLGRPLPKRW